MQKTGLILDAHSLSDLKELAINAERSNLHSIWATELYRTSFQQLAAAASVTTKIKLGTAVALAFVRTPLITSITSLDLDELSSGRFILGLGTGAKRTNEKFHGITHRKPVKRIRECIELIRRITSQAHTNNEIDFDGEFYKVKTTGYKRPFEPVRTKIPIFLAGVGSKMVQTSAECADGYIGHVVCSLKYIEEIIVPSINKGLEITTKSKEDFLTSSIITCAISDDIEKVRKSAKGTIAFYAIVKTYRAPFELHGFAEHADKIREAYFRKDIKGMMNNVTEKMVDTFSVVGSAEECIKKIDRYRKYIDLPILSAPHYFIDFKEVKEYQKTLLEVFGK